ncbi:transmembrane prolyl 4-hydroxylase-like [Asterias amurensis]|uniref:transmembrane prolyl 4-hydroxylase-like n=1 Tax=Asterias amurensis TaxID=7602 RepID=UPI003AB5B9CE
MMSLWSTLLLGILIIETWIQPASLAEPLLHHSDSESGDFDEKERVSFGEPYIRRRLFQLDPVKKDHMQQLELASGQILQIKTLAKDPPLFEIPGFLSQEECDHIKDLAQKETLFTSSVKDSTEREDPQDYEEDPSEDVFKNIDSNEDKVLDAEELLDSIGDFIEVNAFLRQDDILEMLRDNHLDLDGDGALNMQEFSQINREKMQEMKKWLSEHCKNDNSKLNRVSQQAWLNIGSGDEVLTDLREKVTALTGLAGDIVQHSESLQVVYYEHGGHFHAHYDSEELDPKIPCSHTLGTLQEDWDHDHGIRLCRFLTILYYLDETQDGGETAFPVADNETFSEEDLDPDVYDLSHYCYNANVYVQPAKGKAIMWYNHYINQTTGWLGDMNPYSLHGGCDVRQGTKWIANNWIDIDDSYEKQMLYMRASELAQSGKEDGDERSGDRDPTIESFMEAVQNMAMLWSDYLQSQAGAETISELFSKDLPDGGLVDRLVDHVSRAAAEIHIYQHLNPSGEIRQDYVVIWQEVLEAELPTDEGYIFSALIQAANAYAQTAHAATVSDTKPKPTHILKNHNLWDINDGNKLEKDIKYERLMSVEERDEL